MLNLVPSQETAYAEIKRRVEKFTALSKRERNALNEQETRLYYILPLFRALGWDTEDATQMRAEQNIKGKRVDFAFLLNGKPRFLLETKAISEDLNKPEYIKQARDYAWNKGVTWAVLSDFEGTRVFNAEWKEADPLYAQVLNFSVDDYLNRFEELWLLSREAMAAGLLDVKAERDFKKTPRTPITSSLFEQLIEARQKLYKDFTAFNTSLFNEPRLVDDAVQRMLDRLIFLRTAEDRGIEPESLRAIVRSAPAGKVSAALAQHLHTLDAAYNSQLFASHATDALYCTDDTLANVIDGLYLTPSRDAEYNFAAIDADVLGRVYEQYLSSAIANVGAKHLPRGRDAKMDAVANASALPAKRAKRKSQGIYYTPTFVVRYIVQQTLGRYLRENGYNASKPVRVLDPACGSGSFLIEAFDVLDRFLAQQEGSAQDKHDTRAAMRQRRILEQNLFGVDKDEQAVEVARLNLMLKALYQREKLPMLKHIARGDSLISGTDDELEKFFGAEWESKHAFNWHERFTEAMKDGGFDVVVGNPPYVRQETLGQEFKEYASSHFKTFAGTADLYVYFIERAMSLLKPNGVMGFIVASKWMRANYGEPLRRFLNENQIVEIIDFDSLPVFGDATTYPCILILKKAAATKKIRVANIETLEFDDLEAVVQKRGFEVQYESLGKNEWTLADDSKRDILGKIRAKCILLSELADYKIYRGITTGFNEAFVVDKATRAKLIQDDPNSAEIIKPFLLGRDVGRYEIHSQERYLLFTRRGIKINDYPAIKKHLAQFKTRLTPKPKVWKSGEWQGRKAGSYHWYEVQDAIDYFPEFSKRKIITPTIVNRATFAFDEQGLYSNDKTNIIVSDNLFLLGVLNSQVSTFILKQIASTKQGGYFEQKPMYISQMPIPRINFSVAAEKRAHDNIVALVERMLKLKKDLQATNELDAERRAELQERIARTDEEIDDAVFALYGLSEEENQVVKAGGQVV